MIKEKFISCSCHGEGMMLNKFDDEPSLYISFWERGHGRKLSLRNRLRAIWKILKDGSPYEDELVLGGEQIVELKKFLEENYGK